MLKDRDPDDFLASARGGELLPRDHPASSSAKDAGEWLLYYEELLAFTIWLVEEARSLTSELSAEAREMIKLDLVPLEREVEHLQDHCRFWRRRKRELDDEAASSA